MKHKTNYRLKDGDRVEILYPAKVDGYWQDDKFVARGCWESHYIVAGTEGVVVRARTPSVRSDDGLTEYFANIDINHCGIVSRVRLHHDQFRRVK